MKSLRDLVLALLNALRTFLARHAPRGAPRPVRGPAHPWVRAARAPLADVTADIAPNIPPNIRPHLRPASALPPHLAALLARAPDTEPEFVRVHTPFRDLAVRLRIYNPRPPAAPPRVAPASKPTSAVRAARVLDHVTRWIVTASPARRVRAGVPA